RSYIISKRQTIVRLDAVYPEFKKHFDSLVSEQQTQEEIDTFYTGIVESLGFYKLLKLSSTDTFEGVYKSISDTIFKMRYLQIDLYIPFAMNVLRYHKEGGISDEELVEVFKLIETYFSRRIVAGIATTSVDRYLASLHKEIRTFQKADTEARYVDVLSYIMLNRVGQTRMPDDTEYENAIRNREAYYQRNSFLIYVLTAAERKTKDAVHTLKQISSGLRLSVEHVMPQSLTSREWQEMLGDEYERIHKDYLHTLANLTLTGYNSEYSNRSFLDKMHLKVKDKKTGDVQQVGFADSTLPINAWIARRETWDEQTLKERQNWWVERLSETWPLPTTSYEPVEKDTSINLLEAEDLKGREIRSIEVFGEKSSVSTWAEALDVVVESIYNRNPGFIESIDQDDWLPKYIKKDQTAFNISAEILDTGYYVDTGNNTNTKLRIIKALGRLFNIPLEDIKAELTVEANTDVEAAE
ncbi:HNH endonuclease, partial [Candidatus Saccharibacteria bacterium]|nr:HNH endonuclease [Candidatus Saccharibacteria bacterium]